MAFKSQTAIVPAVEEVARIGGPSIRPHHTVIRTRSARARFQAPPPRVGGEQEGSHRNELTHPESDTDDPFPRIPLHTHLEHLFPVLDIDHPDGPVQVTHGDDVDRRGLREGRYRRRGGRVECGEDVNRAPIERVTEEGSSEVRLDV